MRKGVANLPLHYGKAPPWLFNRMVSLSEAILEFLALEFSREEILRRLSDPFWFQALGCALGFDWHSSGITTTVCGALKEALKNLGSDIGMFAVGGKGKSAIETPQQLDTLGERFGLEVEHLKEVSRLVAKVDNTLLQDGYQLYHHVLFFTKDGLWTVVQQGMNTQKKLARRYHWLGEKVESYVEEPHSGISSQVIHGKIPLNLTSNKSKDTREVMCELLKNKEAFLKELDGIRKLSLPSRHYISPKDFNVNKLRETVEKIETNIESFEDLLRIRGIGPKTVRALALVSEIIYGAKPSFEDPARYSFAHGGKDGHPYPVKKDIYDATIETLKEAIAKAKIGEREKAEALKKLSRIISS